MANDLRAMTLGQRLNHQRRALCLTQPDVAARLGVSTATVSRWEQDHRAPSLRHRRTLASVLDVPLDVLFEDVA